jgi:hypothetical protein
MVRFLSILSFAVVLGCLALATTADAQNQLLNQSPKLPPPPLTCVNSAQTVRITALNQNGDPATQPNSIFPVPAACPSNTLGAVDCLRWSYKYELLSGNNISLSAMSADSDIDIIAATGGEAPGSGSGTNVLTAGVSDNAIGGFGTGVFDFRTVRFASQGSVVHGNIFTRTTVGISSVTAISKVGNTSATTCRIAGVGNSESDSAGDKTATTTTQIDQFEQCEIVLTLDGKGCPVTIEATSLDPSVTCTVGEVDFINGQRLRGGPCNKPSGFATGDNSCFFYCPTSTGRCGTVCK